MFFMLDNHSIAVNAVNGLICQNLVKKENVFYIENGFEDCFDNETLVKPLSMQLKYQTISLQNPN